MDTSDLMMRHVSTRPRSMDLFGMSHLGIFAMSVQRGVLFDLERLEANAREVERRHLETENTERKLNQLRQKILSLQARRNELRAELAQAATQTPDLEVTKENKKLIAALKHLRNLREKQNLYRLTGVSVKEKTDTKLILQFDTSYNQDYFEEHYVELQPSSDRDGYKLHHHTLPAFLPLSELEKHLEKDLKVFVDRVREYLLAYVTRHGQVKTVQSRLAENLLSEIEMTFPVDYVCLSLRTMEESPVKVTLTYSDLLFVQPDKVEVSLIDTPESHDILPDESLLKQWEELLMTSPLVTAMAGITGVPMETTDIE